MSEILLQFTGPDDLALVVEDDGQVAYAYLTERGKIVGDVWLYNHGPAPEAFEPVRGRPPRNLRADIDETVAFPKVSPEDCAVEWFTGGVDLRVRGTHVARLKVGSKPGWSLLALKPNPCAKPLRECQSN